MKEHKYYLGKTDNCEAYITWEWKDGKFSMCAEVWRPDKRDLIQAGQCVDSVAALFPNNANAQRMAEIWKRWHLNSMRAGCEHQRDWAKKPIDPSKPTNTYGKHFPGQKQDSWNMLVWVHRNEHPEGLLSFPCPVCGYKYGSSWLVEELPPEVISEIESWSKT